MNNTNEDTSATGLRNPAGLERLGPGLYSPESMRRASEGLYVPKDET